LTEQAPVSIRIVDPEEFITLRVNTYAFGATPSKPDIEKRREGLKYATHTTGLGVFEGSEPLATCNLHQMTENIRGSVLGMGGLGGVASLPQGRRRGHVRNMLAYSFELMHERGMPVSTLYPFRDSFYERLGYAQFPQNRFATIKPENLAPLLRESLPGEVTQQEIATCFDEWWAFQEQLKTERHGFSLMNHSRALQLRDENLDWVALVRENGVVTGAMTFRITGYTQDLVASSFQYTTPVARFQLLAWIARHVDQVKHAIIELGAAEHPETWYRDIYAASSTENEKWGWPSPMGRVISLEALDGLPTPGNGQVSFTLVDDLCPWNAGDWTLSGDGGAIRVTRGGSPACHITIQGLSALVWTGDDPATFPFRHWGDPDTIASATLRDLFPSAYPELNEKF
jgi:hypothetical protein